jgi:tRNA nucleotidyltransferase (CCA-adding enzyme)
MQFYVVGGYVRDKILGRAPKDRDLVAVGATQADMLEYGCRPVGKDFPTFIGPDGEEISMARRSRNGGVAEFGPEVTLEEDLAKRDLTINAMAMGEAYEGAAVLIDPFFGQDDLLNKVLRMVSEEAFREDPIRVLRVARFAARLPDFRIDTDTMHVMKSLVMEGKLDNLVPERVWKELHRGLMETQPSRMLQVLRTCGALKAILPEVDALYGVPQPAQWHPEVDTGIHIEQVLDYAASQDFALPVRVAALLHDVGKALTPADTWPAHHGHEGMGERTALAVCERLRVPDAIARVVAMTTREHGNVHAALKLRPVSVTRLLRKCDAFRNPDRFQYMLQACMCDARGRKSNTVSFENVEYPQAMRLSGALWAARQVKGHDIAAKFKDRPEEIAVHIHAERARAIRRFEKQHPTT